MSDENVPKFDYDSAFDYARYDIISDVECAVMREPSFYERKYAHICEYNGYDADVLKGFKDGIARGFDEAL